MQSLACHRQSGLWLLALVNDKGQHSCLRLSGVRVRGVTPDIASLPDRFEPLDIIIAAPSDSIATVREVSVTALKSGRDGLTFPAVSELFDCRATTSDLRKCDVVDLMGRQPVDLDCAAIADQISGRRVLVSQAVRTIDPKLWRQISRFGLSRLLMLDRDESGLSFPQL